MKRTSRKEFGLIPSVQLRSERPAPTYLTAAIPITVSGAQKSPLYAVIDTAVQMSCIDKTLLSNVRNLEEMFTGEKLIYTAGREQFLKIVKVSVIIHDQDSVPWIRFNEVPFAVMEPVSLERQNRIILGYDSMLANLRLTFDYVRGKLWISAPTKALVSENTEGLEVLPSRIREADALIKSGSYSAAVTLIAAGLEELYEQFSETSKKQFWLLDEKEIGKVLPQKYAEQIYEIRRLRNEAVHGSIDRQSIGNREAQRALLNAKSIAVFLQEGLRLPSLTSKKVISILQKHGFRVVRLAGSHSILKHPEMPGIQVTVPVAIKALKRGILAMIIKQAGMSLQDFS